MRLAVICILPLLFFSHNSRASDGTLIVGTVEGASFGFSYNAQFDHKEFAEFKFETARRNLQLNVTGYDIDFLTEVGVSVNGNSIGNLATSASDRTSITQLSIPKTVLVLGSNTIKFTQSVPGNRWGVADVLVKKSPDITIGVADTNDYGNNYNGDYSHPAFADFRLVGKPDADTELTVDGFDIDTNTEISVLLNNELVGYLDTSPNDGVSTTRLKIPAAVYKTGENILRFKEKNRHWRWGVSNVLIDIVEPNDIVEPIAVVEPTAPNNLLTIGIGNSDNYGYAFSGVSNAQESAEFLFEGTNEVLTLTVAGYDIDTDTEVEVLINGNSIGFLQPTPDNGFALNSLPVNIEDQVSGTNTVTFRQIRLGNRWGVTDLLLTYGCNYPLVQN